MKYIHFIQLLFGLFALNIYISVISRGVSALVAGIKIYQVDFFLGPIKSRFCIYNIPIVIRQFPLLAHIKFRPENDDMEESPKLVSGNGQPYDECSFVKKLLFLICSHVSLFVLGVVALGPLYAWHFFTNGFERLFFAAYWPAQHGAVYIEKVLRLYENGDIFRLVGMLALVSLCCDIIPFQSSSTYYFLKSPFGICKSLAFRRRSC